MSIVVEELTKRYAGHPVVNGVSLEVAEGEFFVLLGSSGSGKSTLLRMIAGLSEIDGGRVRLHDVDVTDLPAARRGVGFVFQSYALFRGMTVAENVEFALSIRGVAKAERRRRREELLDMVGLSGLGRRTPGQLSGGQQQRVALARALAHRPEVLLLDEPFGALDAKVRSELRRTVREVQRELGISTIFVTHDQEEAFELADRLGVMSYGRLLEVGPPEELYLRPETEFVATFLGTANLMVGESTPAGVRLGPVEFPLVTQTAAANRRVQVLFRPEDVALRPRPEELRCAELGVGTVDERSFVGSFERLRLRLPPLRGVRTIAPAGPFGSDDLWVEASRTQDVARRYPLRVGETVSVGVQRVHALIHPGLRFLVPDDGSRRPPFVLPFAGDLARGAQARVVVLCCGPAAGEEAAQRARELVGGGLAALDVRSSPAPLAPAVAEETARRPCDLVLAGRLGGDGRDDVELAESLLAAGPHHLLLVPEGAKAADLEKVLVCMAVGEPGKEDTAFAARLARHLHAEATLLTVIAGEERSDAAGERARAERFLERNRRAALRLGVPVETRVRYGDAVEEILATAQEGGHDLVVIGTPLRQRGRELALRGVVARLLGEIADRPLLIVRSPQVAP
jgi:sulfate transport system ATP-binding protein